VCLNQFLRLTIEKLVYGGDGLARLPADDHGRGKAAFLPFVVAGEEVEASILEEKPGFARAHAEAIIAPSPHRIAPPCPYFQRCGGCHYQHADYEHQLEIKASILRENLRRIARLELQTELTIHPSPPWNYRNRARLRLQSVPEFAVGYFKQNSHELLPVEQCPISSPLINRAISRIWKLGRAGEFAAAIEEVELFANADDSQLLLEAFTSSDNSESAKTCAEQLRRLLPGAIGASVFESRVSESQHRTSGPAKLLASSGSSSLDYKTKLATYRVSAGSFFQVNRYLIDELVEIVTGGRSGKTALDVYAGVGLFSSVLNREFERVIAVEPSPTSHADLLYNSSANVKAVRATTEQHLKNVGGKLRPDLVVVDPPRSGLGESVIRGLVNLDSPRISYVSCDPSTLARDLGGLLGAGYRLEQAHLVDLFPQTYHVESVFHLVR
jgi:23S rRNA (uracil1939-C5)-methyltransferase